MPIHKRHAPTIFLLVMVSTMVLVMSLVLGWFHGAFANGFWNVWPRQAAIAFLVALPAASGARKVANLVVARLTA